MDLRRDFRKRCAPRGTQDAAHGASDNSLVIRPGLGLYRAHLSDTPVDRKCLLSPKKDGISVYRGGKTRTSATPQCRSRFGVTCHPSTWRPSAALRTCPVQRRAQQKGAPIQRCDPALSITREAEPIACSDRLRLLVLSAGKLPQAISRVAPAGRKSGQRFERPFRVPILLGCNL
jgi:hypothetical protein